MFNPLQLTTDIDAIFLQFPDLAEDEELRRTVLENGTDFLPAVKACLEVMFEAEAMTIGIDTRIESLTTRSHRLERKAAAMRALIQRLMEHAHEKKLTFPEATLSIRQIQRHVVIEDETLLTDEYIRIKREPNKKLIKEMLDHGVVVDGACLSNGGQTLSVRTK
jgi:hypothetical protein